MKRSLEMSTPGARSLVTPAMIDPSSRASVSPFEQAIVPKEIAAATAANRQVVRARRFIHGIIPKPRGGDDG